jgi:hypothetical protein
MRGNLYSYFNGQYKDVGRWLVGLIERVVVVFFFFFFFFLRIIERVFVPKK